MVHIQIQYIDTPFATTPKFLIATYVGPAFTNVPMTATDTSTVVLGDTAYTHDANGNLTSDATFTYQYDTANQLTNVIRKSDNTTVLSCRYDALGRRVEAIRSDGTVDRYVFFPGSFLVLAVLDENNVCKEFYTRGPDLSGSLDSAGGIGGILACTYASGPALYHHADLMGNVIALTGASGAVTSTFRYAPFGQLISHLGTATARFLFSSKEWNSDTRLVYFGHRFYCPQFARWITIDPIANIEIEIPSWHSFAINRNASTETLRYLMNNNAPLNWGDSWGLSFWCNCSIEYAEPPKEGIGFLPSDTLNGLLCTSENEGMTQWMVDKGTCYSRLGIECICENMICEVKYEYKCSRYYKHPQRLYWAGTGKMVKIDCHKEEVGK